MQISRRTQDRFWRAVLACAVAGITLATEAQAQQPRRDRLVRVVIPDGMPVFDPAVRERHKQAVVPRALAFPTGPGEDGVSVVLLNPRHADLDTFVSALSVLARALDEGRTEIQAVIEPEPRARGGPNMANASRDLARLKTSPHMSVPRLVGPGRMIEVIVDLAVWRSGGNQ